MIAALDPFVAHSVPDLGAFGITAFVTGRAAGTFGFQTDEPARAVNGRWDALRQGLAAVGVHRLATAHQVHGAHVLVHGPGWEGLLRAGEADGQACDARGTALAVTVADCVPVLVAHPAGAVAALHSGWRGTAARIVERGIAALAHRGFPAGELRVHLGPAICGRCYEVSPDVYGRLTGRSVSARTPVDLRAIIADQARAAGARHVTVAAECTRCDDGRFYSHRAGDVGRQIGVIVAP